MCINAKYNKKKIINESEHYTSFFLLHGSWEGKEEAERERSNKGEVRHVMKDFLVT